MIRSRYFINYFILQAIEKVIDTLDLLSLPPMEALKLTDLNTFYTAAREQNCKVPDYKVPCNYS